MDGILLSSLGLEAGLLFIAFKTRRIHYVVATLAVGVLLPYLFEAWALGAAFPESH